MDTVSQNEIFEEDDWCQTNGDTVNHLHSDVTDTGTKHQSRTADETTETYVPMEPPTDMSNIFTDAVLAACCVVIILYLTKEVLDIDNVFPWLYYKRIKKFGYSHTDGPHTWKSGAYGRRQSPVNIRSERVQQLDGCPPLQWPGYDTLPCRISLTNDGTTAVLRGCWVGRGSRAPALTGGPLGEVSWPFAWAEFHWGPSDDEGSEHTLDYCRYALELQLVHGPCYGTQHDHACVAVLFEVCPEDNPYLDPVVQALRRVQRPGCCTQLLPFPLDWLSPPMAQEYLSYSGSLTRPPCSEGVLWILRPQPLTISSRQVSEFRRLLDRNCEPLVRNARPVQRLHGRPVCCYCE